LAAARDWALAVNVSSPLLKLVLLAALAVGVLALLLRLSKRA